MAKRKCLEWGFDLTDFPSHKDWKDYLKKHRCKLVKKVKLYGDYAERQYGHKPDHYLYSCNGVGITTTHPGRATKKRPEFGGFIGYVGVEFTEKAKKKWKKMRDDFVANANIKEEKRCESQFVSPPSMVKKMKPEK